MSYKTKVNMHFGRTLKRAKTMQIWFRTNKQTGNTKCNLVAPAFPMIRPMSPLGKCNTMFSSPTFNTEDIATVKNIQVQNDFT